jgi:carbon monoxide dehydrogenase subunit G
VGRFHATFVVAAVPDDVVRYLADYGNTVHWDPGTVRCTRVGGGAAVTVGAEWENVSEFRGAEVSLSYQLVELSASRVRFEGSGRGATTSDDFTIGASEGHGTRIEYEAVITLKTWRKVAEPFLRGLYARMGAGAVEGITRELAHDR